MAEYPQQTVQTASGQISFRRAGAGASVVLLHGIGSGSASWAYQLPALAKNFDTCAWDAPGYGQSSLAPAALMPCYVRALAALMDALEIAQAIVVGHSLGALMAGAFARKHPQRVAALVLASPASGHARLDRVERESRRDSRVEALRNAGVEEHAAARSVRLLSANADECARDLVIHNLRALNAEGYASAAQILCDGDLLDDVANLTVPACVTCGSEDVVTPPASARTVAAAFATPVDYQEIPGAGHACYIEQPQAFNTTLTQFIHARFHQ